MIYKSRILARRAAMAGTLALLSGCGGAFGVGNTTNPGSTSNIPPQSSYRVVGDIGTPFVATVSDSRSSWVVHGTVPESIVIVNDAPADRIMVTKLANDSRLLSLEVIAGLTVTTLSSTTENYGSVVGQLTDQKPALTRFAPPASPDVRFFVRGPAIDLFDATIEDLQNSNILQARVPAVLLFDSPNGGSSGRVDGIFNEVTFFGPLDVELIINGNVKQVFGGTTVSIKGDT